MSKYSDRAISYFSEGMNCCQSVLSAFHDRISMDEQQCIRMGAAFVGGMANTQGTCGAVTGALMVIGGYFYNPERPEITVEIVNQYAQTFFNLFMDKYKHLNCRDLSGTDFSDAAAKEKAKAEGMYENCKELIKDSCFIVEEMLKMYPKNQQ